MKFKKIFSHIKQLRADIAFLQETHIRSCDSSRLARGWAGQVYQSNFCSKARGVAIMIGKNVQFTASHVQTDSSVRFVIVVGKLYSLPIYQFTLPIFFSAYLICHHIILYLVVTLIVHTISSFRVIIKIFRSNSKRASLSKSAHSS